VRSCKEDLITWAELIGSLLFVGFLFAAFPEAMAKLLVLPLGIALALLIHTWRKGL
jgi:hypothetical protein